MSDLSLKAYFGDIGGSSGVRSCCAPGMNISLRYLMMPLRIIHISDLHFTDSDHTWDVGGPLGIRRDTPDNAGRQALADFLIAKRRELGSDVIVITGDLTDSGGDKDYPIAAAFINKLEAAGFRVFSVPGNHDYCFEGNLFFEDVFKAVQKVDTTEAIAAIAAGFALGGHLGASIAATAETIKIEGKIKDIVRSELTSFIGGVPDEFVDAIAALFVVAVISMSPPINLVINMTDTAENNARRNRFIRFITPNDTSKYPHSVDFPSGRLILLDSMQEKLDKQDGDPGGRCAQGKLGRAQLSVFAKLVSDYQPQRQLGKKLVVAMHHSPFHAKGDQVSEPFHGDSTGCLEDYDTFLAIANRSNIDCILFGHTSPDSVFQQPRNVSPNTSTEDKKNLECERFATYEMIYASLVNCENLEQVPGAPLYPVSVLDLNRLRRAVFCTGTPLPATSFGNATGKPV